MPLFTLTCLDIENGVALRQSVRPDHLAYLENHRDSVKLAGPLLHHETGTPIGSHLIIEAQDLKAVQDFATNDPYAKAGLFGSTQIHAFRATIGSLAYS
jgi:uncharacterized protein